ncbi:MAG TPA: dTDP-4-dehydrorhamnose reductase [Chitinophagaceae bacterium]|nr:dTDP-4-dehydrorhamnose reductase [Chitinophagaceae bacterium]
MQTILVTGAKGQLGSELRRLAPGYPAFHFIFTDKEELSIADPDAINNFFDEYKPAYCINCAAYTAVDKAESDKESAELLNATAVKYLAEACAKNGARFIHISTDYVFDGKATAPIKEDMVPDPVSVYGVTKLKGEELAIKHNPETILIRTAWVYSSFGHNFVKTMLRLMNERSELNVVNDQKGTPTYAADLAAAILHIIDSGKWIPGIYHYANEGEISWYDFAVAIKEIAGSACAVNPIPTSAYPTPATRPAYSVFDKEKIKATFGVAIPEWRESLERCVQGILRKSP